MYVFVFITVQHSNEKASVYDNVFFFFIDYPFYICHFHIYVSFSGLTIELLVLLSKKQSLSERSNLTMHRKREIGIIQVLSLTQHSSRHSDENLASGK